MSEAENLRARQLLDRLLRLHGIGRRDADRRLGRCRGQTGQMLSGRIALKYDHILETLALIDVDPAVFFAALFRQGRARQNVRLGEELMARLVETLGTEGQLSLMPTVREDTPAALEEARFLLAQLDRRVEEVRALFGVSKPAEAASADAASAETPPPADVPEGEKVEEKEVRPKKRKRAKSASKP